MDEYQIAGRVVFTESVRMEHACVPFPGLIASCAEELDDLSASWCGGHAKVAHFYDDDGPLRVQRMNSATQDFQFGALRVNLQAMYAHRLSR